MLSRVADSLYWMSRYVERAEHTARLIAVKLESMVEQTPDDANASWARVIEALTGEKTVLGPQDAFAITRKDDGAYLGSVGLHKRDGEAFEFGYWLGKPFWGQGYATEAARRLIAFAFMELQLESLIAGFFHDNPASGHVLEKLGCMPDGTDQRECLARGHAVYCHKVVLTRDSFWKKKAA